MKTYTFAMDMRAYLTVRAENDEEAERKAQNSDFENWDISGDNFDLDKDSIELLDDLTEDDAEDDE